MKCTGPCGTGNRNERGERLLDFAEENKLVVTNSFFFKAANRYMGSSRGCDQNQIDFIPSSDRKIVRNCEVITKVDIGSDYRLVRARVEIDKLMSPPPPPPPKKKSKTETETRQIRPQRIRKISHPLQN